MNQYVSAAEMCIEVTFEVNHQTQEDTNMAPKNNNIAPETANNGTSVVTPEMVTKPDTYTLWHNVLMQVKEKAIEGFHKGRDWAVAHPKQALACAGAMSLVLLLKLRNKKTNNAE